MDRSPRQKTNRETLTLNDTLGQINVIDIYRTFHTRTAECTFFSIHGMFFRIDHITGHKTRLNEFKKTKIISSTFFGHNTITRNQL